MSTSIIQTLTRKAPLVAAKPKRHTGLRAVAEQLDRRLVDAAAVELLTEALHRLAVLCYEQDAAGFVNVDGVTGRILIPVPWGRAGRGKWGLYPSEADTLRSLLHHRRKSSTAPLFVYDRARRSWLLNLGGYPDLRAALHYLKTQSISVGEYRLHYRRVRR